MKTPALLALLALGPVSRLTAADAPKVDHPPTEVLVLDHAKVDNAFAKGMPLLINTDYKIQAGRRAMPGIVEIHEHDTDILYFLEGSATIITGGKTENAKTTDAGEIRGDKIIGGTPRKVTKGDIMVIPSGIPHWFSEVNGTCLYFVVKVTK
ncbi:MAG: cupin domain-containing protein [Verrucomicrobiota bacterium]